MSDAPKTALDELAECMSGLRSASATPVADPKASPEESARNWWVVCYGEEPWENDGDWVALKAAFSLACADERRRASACPTCAEILKLLNEVKRG